MSKRLRFLSENQSIPLLPDAGLKKINLVRIEYLKLTGGKTIKISFSEVKSIPGFGKQVNSLAFGFQTTSKNRFILLPLNPPPCFAEAATRRRDFKFYSLFHFHFSLHYYSQFLYLHRLSSTWGIVIKLRINTH